MYSVPLIHGPKYISLGFVFGYGLSVDRDCYPYTEGKGEGGVTESSEAGAVVAYLSDISEMPEKTMEFLQSLRRIDVLVIDMLLGPGQSHFSHYCMDQAVALTEALRPRRMLGVGMFCELEHLETNKHLAELLAERHREGRMLSVVAMELAHDGLELDISACKLKVPT
jgi:hypothetical protein